MSKICFELFALFASIFLGSAVVGLWLWVFGFPTVIAGKVCAASFLTAIGCGILGDIVS